MNSTPLNVRVRAALLGGVLLVTGAVAFFTQQAGAREESKAPPVRLNIDDQEVKRDAQLRTSFAPVVRDASHSVVNVFTTTKPRRVEGMPSIHPFFREFFGDQFPGGGGRQMMTPRQNGLGSGVILTEDGYILTNNHVIEGADEIQVALNPDGRQFPAKVIGRDPKTDLAVLKIEADGLKAIRVGNSDQVEVGDVVLAIGNPFGVGQTVTMGIVGATSREVFGASIGLEYEDFLQTDAAINPGNSGGALVDAEGRLIGINTAILSRGGGNNGVGFAVPINMARSVMEGIVAHGRVIRGFLGVALQNVDPGLAKEFKLPNENGALVAEVVPRSPAQKSGIKSGDVITRFDNREIRNSRQLRLLASQTAPDREVQVTVVRDGEPRELTVKLSEKPDNDRIAGLRGDEGGSSPADIGGLQGVVVADVTPEARQRFSIPREIQGALVSEVEEDSEAFRAGLRPGDVIREINREEVRDAESAIDLAQNLEKSRILLRVWRQGGNRFVVVDETGRR